MTSPVEPCPVCHTALHLITEVETADLSNRGWEYHYECPGCTLSIKAGRSDFQRCWHCTHFCSRSQCQWFGNAGQRSDDEETTGRIAHIKDLLSQGMSYEKVAAQLNELGWKTLRGKAFDRYAIRHIVNNRIRPGTDTASRPCYCSEDCYENSRNERDEDIEDTELSVAERNDGANARSKPDHRPTKASAGFLRAAQGYVQRHNAAKPTAGRVYLRANSNQWSQT